MLVSFAVLGCGGGLDKFPTAKVSGKVLCDGQPVADVRIYFAPVGKKKSLEVGKSGFGTAKADGTFVVSTYGNEDGAVVGRHKVMVSGPHPEEAPRFTCNCETNGNKVIQEVEVKAGSENNFTITLPAKTPNSKPNISAEDLEDVENVAEEQHARAGSPK
jgi:hypothetical protein